MGTTGTTGLVSDVAPRARTVGYRHIMRELERSVTARTPTSGRRRNLKDGAHLADTRRRTGPPGGHFPVSRIRVDVAAPPLPRHRARRLRAARRLLRRPVQLDGGVTISAERHNGRIKVRVESPADRETPYSRADALDVLPPQPDAVSHGA